MSKTPGTVSKILWHFTGGPGWDSSISKQTGSCKPNKSSFEALNGILSSGLLRASTYRESIKFCSIDSGFSRIPGHARISEGEIKTKSVVCVADIPIQHLSYHSNRYGKFAIGFKRESLLRAGFNPVSYSHSDFGVAKNFIELITELTNFINLLKEHDEVRRETFLKVPNSILNEFSKHFGGLDPQLILEDHMHFLYEAIEDLIHRVSEHAGLVKTFNSEDMDIIFPEREWRLCSDFHFNLNDVAMIVLPRSGEWFEKFIKTRADLPRSIPIVPWEDLIEH